MIESVSAIIAGAIACWILWPLRSAVGIAPSEETPDSSLEQRYAQARLDLESDVLGGRVTDAEFEQRSRELQAAYRARRE